MKYFEKISGKRIYLSPMCKQDIELYTKWLNDPAVSDNLGYTWQLIGVEKETGILEQLSKDGHTFAIVRREDGELLGNAGLLNVNQVHRGAECGIFIGEESNRGKGYGREALGFLLGYCFDVLNLNNIMLRVYDFNIAAISCYKSLGFKTVGERRKAYFLGGTYHNEIYMDILPKDFKNART